MHSSGEILIYKSTEGRPEIQVRLENGTLWLDQYQLSELFQTDRTSIGRHISNIYKSGELQENATCAKFAQVQKEGSREIKRQIKVYNLDLIISVGYRVNSKRGTQFRIWSTNVLKEHLIQGYSLNQRKLDELKKTIQLVNRTSEQIATKNQETKGLIDVLSDYALALDILDDYDHQRLTTDNTNSKVSYKISYQEAKKAIEQLKQKFGGSSLFGNEKDDSFKSSIAVIDQTFDGLAFIQV
ncbi:virulence RhuM family protein [Adhaeribacter soli]|uniref:virulence RhuM family protein n=1 Tax=Adhaeribacter soli TaxID=2607655 RepID=UPI001CDA07F2|nr:RhuM family protein [Adhaeribacter soli]